MSLKEFEKRIQFEEQVTCVFIGLRKETQGDGGNRVMTPASIQNSKQIATVLKKK